MLPFLLCNGSVGIGTGWSTSVPAYHPKQIATLVKSYLLSDVPTPGPMVPWTRGFTGSVEKVSEGRYEVRGKARVLADGTVEISELPIGTWTTAYKETLESLITSGHMHKFTEHHGEDTVRFLVYGIKDPVVDGDFFKRFGLVDNISVSNLTAIDEEGRVQRFASVELMVERFVRVRLEGYMRRKVALVAALEAQLRELDIRVLFVDAVVGGRLVVMRRKHEDVVADVMRLSTTVTAASVDPLLSMPIRSLTQEKVESLRRKKIDMAATLAATRAKSEKDMWVDDIDNFLALWEKDMKNNELTATAGTVKDTVVTGKQAKSQRKRLIVFPVPKKTKRSKNSDKTN